ncbi:hypothetical protein HY768_11095 [candidate division TA06 bacterium]|uniref:Lipoprotein n=1 Tax=candidate division TA06 bacterium TaxID=2250710 RepID=A0A933MKG2_UNCT6|nr:hypothetical protein [candidate division TA06 bacterium]
MKKLFASLFLVVFCFAFIGCATIKVGGNAQLAPTSSVGEKIASKRCWFALWGLVPLGDNTTDSMVPANSKVRFETKMTTVDFLLGLIVGGLTLQTKTVEVYQTK